MTDGKNTRLGVQTVIRNDSTSHEQLMESLLIIAAGLDFLQDEIAGLRASTTKKGKCTMNDEKTCPLCEAERCPASDTNFECGIPTPPHGTGYVIDEEGTGCLQRQLVRQTERANRFEQALRDVGATELDAVSRPEIVCLCGSTRFMDEFHQVNRQLTLLGYIVLSVAVGKEPMTPAIKDGLNELHRRKIDLAEWVMIINIDHYVGDGTYGEVIYAHRQGKRVHLLVPDQIDTHHDISALVTEVVGRQSAIAKRENLDAGPPYSTDGLSP